MLAELLDDLLATPTQWLHCDPRGRVTKGNSPTRVLFPGSFNPLHRGHRMLAALAVQHLGEPLTYEISIANVDKPPLTLPDIQARLQQFTEAAVCITCAPLFRTKALLFPKTTFVIGADTASRILAPKYYPQREAGMHEALATIAAAGCRFFVGGRCNAEGLFLDVDGLTIPEPFRNLFIGLNEEQFRVDLSSTELRRC